VTVYDAETRSRVQTDHGKAALRSMFELKDKAGETTAELYFEPKAPAGKEEQWIETIPGKGSFVYLRVYGPNKPRSTATESQAILKTSSRTRTTQVNLNSASVRSRLKAEGGWSPDFSQGTPITGKCRLDTTDELLTG
jgi:hypothetical protein